MVFFYVGVNCAIIMDRQSTDAVAEVCSVKSSAFLQRLSTDGHSDIVYTVVPELFRQVDDNIKKVLKSPSAFTLSADPSVLIVSDFAKGTLVSVRLHYPAEVKELANGLDKPMSVCVMYGAVIVAETGRRQIAYVDYKNACN
jgi:hypothetical protein